MRLLDLPDALRDQGLEPVIVDGWLRRGNDFVEPPRIHIRHWTAGPAAGKSPCLGIVTNGRSDLPGPLAQDLQERSGFTAGDAFDRVFVVASGVANHAGAGNWAGIDSGNRKGTGNEIEWSGPGEAFPPNRIETSVRIAAAYQSLHPDPGGQWCCEHREYALPKGRKIDTNLNGSVFRASVQALLEGDGEDMKDDERAALMATQKMVATMMQGLIPRPLANASTAGDNFGQLDASGEPVSDVWRFAAEGIQILRKLKDPATIAAAVVKALPETSGGTGLTVADVEAAVIKAINAELGFLKPGQ